MALVGEVVQLENGKIEVKVPVTYAMMDYVQMEFDSVEDMMEKLEDQEFVDQMPLGEDGQYLSGSYEIDFTVLEVKKELDESVGDEEQ